MESLQETGYRARRVPLIMFLIILDTETDTFYSFRGGFDYYIKDEKLYVTCFGYDRVHNLYEVSFPDD